MELWGTHHFNKNDLVLVACSGGPDSMCLCHLLLKGSYNFHIAHANYQLRGIDSNQDAAFVKSWANEHNIPVHLNAFNTAEEMKLRELSVQECARVLRYTWFDQLVKEYKYKYVLTAHHRDDSIETFFINSFRGTGIKGLKGIPSIRENIIRPLINYSKTEIFEYIKTNGIAYRIDSSNSKDDYLRNRIRNQLIPLIKELYPSAEVGLVKTISVLGSQSAYLKEKLDEELQKIITHSEETSTYHFQNDDFNEIRLFHWLEKYGFNYDQIRQIVLRSTEKKSGIYWESKTHKVLLDRGSVQLIVKSIYSTFNEFISHPGKTEKTINNRIKIMIVDLKKELIDFNKYFYLSADKLSWPIIARNWKHGDAFNSYGLKGKSKKLSDFFIDSKIPRIKKSDLIILESKGVIVFVESIGINYNYRKVESTIQALRIEMLDD